MKTRVTVDKHLMGVRIQQSTLLAVGLLCLFLSACGQRGALYLPPAEEAAPETPAAKIQTERQ